MLEVNNKDVLTYFQFNTARLILKPVDHSALDMLTELYGCNKIMKYIAPPLSRSETKAMLDNILHKQSLEQYDNLILEVKSKINGLSLGVCGVLNFDLNNKKAEVGVMLFQKGQGQGLAVEVIKAVVHKLIAIGVIDIYMNIAPDNKAAIIGAKKVGFTSTNISNYFVYSKLIKINKESKNECSCKFT